MQENGKPQEKPPEGNVGFRTVLSVFRSAGKRGDMALCGGLAAKLMLAPTKASEEGIERAVGKSKDIDLYVFNGKPFGQPLYPHEWVQVDLSDHDRFIPAEVIYRPAPYFGFKEPRESDLLDLRHPSGIVVPMVGPSFYIASVFNSIPYKEDALRLANRVRGRHAISKERVDELLSDSRLIGIFPGGYDEIMHSFPLKSMHLWEGFAHELRRRSEEKAVGAMPFLARLNMDSKMAYDALLMDTETAGMLGNGYERVFGGTNVLQARLCQVVRHSFPDSYFARTGNPVVDGLTEAVKSGYYMDRVVNGEKIAPENWDFGGRALWLLLYMMETRANEPEFLHSSRMWAYQQSASCPSPLMDFLEAQASFEISIEKTATFFRLLKDAKEIAGRLVAMDDFTRFGLSLCSAIRFCPVFVLSAGVEAELSAIKAQIKDGAFDEAAVRFAALPHYVDGIRHYILGGGSRWTDTDDPED